VRHQCGRGKIGGIVMAGPLRQSISAGRKHKQPKRPKPEQTMLPILPLWLFMLAAS